MVRLRRCSRPRLPCPACYWSCSSPEIYSRSVTSRFTSATLAAQSPGTVCFVPGPVLIRQTPLQSPLSGLLSTTRGEISFSSTTFRRICPATWHLCRGSSLLSSMRHLTTALETICTICLYTDESPVFFAHVTSQAEYGIYEQWSLNRTGPTGTSEPKLSDSKFNGGHRWSCQKTLSLPMFYFLRRKHLAMSID